MDIRKHFAEALNLSVSAVALGYNNSEEIGQYQVYADPRTPVIERVYVERHRG
jgi:hypothetical protein